MILASVRAKKPQTGVLFGAEISGNPGNVRWGSTFPHGEGGGFDVAFAK